MSATLDDTARRQVTASITLDETRTTGTSLRVSGHAAVYDSPSDPDALPWREVLLPGAFRSALAKGKPVSLLWQHDTAQPLAKTGAGLTLSEDATGLRFSATMANTQAARDAVELLRSKVVTQMSFGFSMRDGGRDREELRDGEVWRMIEQVGTLYEISLVTEPAYPATSAEARTALAIARRMPLAMRDRTSYGPDSEHSYFRDLWRVNESKQRAQAVAFTPGAGSRDPGEPAAIVMGRPASRAGDSIEAARRRLAVADEHRAVSTAAGSMDAFASQTAPFIAGLFATSARAAAVVAGALRQEPLPVGGMLVSLARLSSGASAAIRTDNQAVSDSDVVSSGVTSRVATIDGDQVASVQLVEQSPGGVFDTMIAQELGKAYAERLEIEVLNGDGTAGHVAGLLNITGIKAVSYTDASPTQQEAWLPFCQLGSQVATALGEPADLLALHPRRAYWMRSALDTAGAQAFESETTAAFDWPGDVLEAPAMPTTLGGGTEDALIVANRAYTILASRPPTFETLTEILSGTLSVRFLVYGYSALLVRQPVAVGKVTGTGMAAPVGF